MQILTFLVVSVVMAEIHGLNGL